MNRHSDTDSHSQAGNWLMGTARRHPEALLLLAAGCALVTRSGGGTSRHEAAQNRYREPDHSYPTASNPSGIRQGLSRTAEKAADYASEIKDRVTDTASSYAESVSEFATDARRKSERLKRQAQTTMQTIATLLMKPCADCAWMPLNPGNVGASGWFRGQCAPSLAWRPGRFLSSLGRPRHY